MSNVDNEIATALFEVEPVVDIFEEYYPKDKRPRNALQAVKDCLSGMPTTSLTAHSVAAAQAGDGAWAAAGYAADAVSKIVWAVDEANVNLKFDLVSRARVAAAAAIMTHKNTKRS